MTCDTVELYYEDTRQDRPALLLIAGLASDEISWVFQKEALSVDHRLITFDNRGVGRSPKPPGPYSIAQMAGDVTRLLDTLGIEKVSVVGHSMGGAIAQYLAIHSPERVEKLVLACTFSKLRGRALPVVEGWAGLLRLGADAELIGQSLFPWLYTERFLSQPGVFQACLDALAQHPYPLDGDAVTAQVAALQGFDSTSDLHRIQAPCLVLAAEHDLLVSPSSARELARSIPKAAFQEVADTGHSLMLETPEEFSRAVAEFLRA